MKQSVSAIKTYTITALCFLAILTSCKQDIDEVNKISGGEKKELPIESSYDIELLYSDSAKIQMKLNAKQIDRYLSEEKSHFELPEGLHMLFYSNYPAVETELLADYGTGFDNQKGIEEIEVERNVIVINQKGEKLNTEKLTWNAVKKQIYTDQFVKITTKDEILWGDGLVASENFSEYEIKNIKGQINIKQP